MLYIIHNITTYRHRHAQDLTRRGRLRLLRGRFRIAPSEPFWVLQKKVYLISLAIEYTLLNHGTQVES